MNKVYQVYQVSDSTGEALDRIFLAIKAQFLDFECKTIHYSFTRTKNQIDKIIDKCKEEKNVIVLYTIIDKNLSKNLSEKCKENNLIVIPYGGGTSVVGHINPEISDKPVLTIDMVKMNSILSIDTESQLATFGAGAPGPVVEEELKKHGYTLGHFPQSWELSTLGGWVASRSSGQQSLHYGRIENMFAGGTIETLNGTMTIPTIPASSAGP